MRRKDDEKEQRIKEAVIEVALEEGFGGASISKIAKRAGVSPATVYIYHENKECLLQNVYMECAEELYSTLLSDVQDVQSKRNGRDLVDHLIRGYFNYMVQNANQAGFVQQFSSSPALTHNCSEICGFNRLMSLLQEWIDEDIFRPYSVINVFSLLFNPVKMLAAGSLAYHTNAEAPLEELIRITQSALLEDGADSENGKNGNVKR